MTKQKNPKVGDTVQWVIYDLDTGYVIEDAKSRSDARDSAKSYNDGYDNKPFRVARIVLDK